MARKITQEYVVKDKGSKTIKSATDKINKNLKDVERTSKSVSSKISAQWKTVAAAFGGVIIARALVNFSRDILTMGDRLDKLSQQLGISVDFLSKLKQSAELGGSSLERMNTGIRMMIRNLDMAARETGDAYLQLQKFNISAKELISIGPEKALQRIAQEALKIKDPMEKANFLMGIFGTRIGTEIIPLLKDLSKGMKGFNAELTGEQATSFAAFNDSLTELRSRLIAIGAVVLKPLIDDLTGLANKLNDAFDPKNPEEYAKSMQKLNDIMETVLSVLKGLLIASVVAGSFALLGKAIRGLIGIAGFRTLGSLLSAIGGALTGASRAAGPFTAFLSVLKDKQITTALASILASIKAITATLLPFIGAFAAAAAGLLATYKIAKLMEELDFDLADEIGANVAGFNNMKEMRAHTESLRMSVKNFFDETDKRARMTGQNLKDLTSSFSSLHERIRLGLAKPPGVTEDEGGSLQANKSQVVALKALRREIELSGLNHFAIRRKQLQQWRTDQLAIFKKAEEDGKDHYEGIIATRIVFRERMMKIDHEQIAFNKARDKAVETSMVEHRVFILEAQGKIFKALRLAEQLRFAQEREQLKATFEGHTNLWKLLEEAAKKHTIRMREILGQEAVAGMSPEDRRNPEIEKLEGMKEAAERAKENFKRMEENLKENIDKIADYMGDRIGNGLIDIITATEDMGLKFKEVLRNMAIDIAKLLATSAFKELIAMLLKTAGGASGGGGGAFASILGAIGGMLAGGGPANAGTSYLVGEKGPEIFTPRTSGYVSPNGATSGATMNVVNNVTIEGGGGGGDANEQKRNAKQIAMAIDEKMKQIIATQMRPGGIMNPHQNIPRRA